MFSSSPKFDTVAIAPGQVALVFDDVFREPRHWVELAAAQPERFEDSPHNAYPGPELRMPEVFSARLDEFFARHVRMHLGARRTLRMYSRLSLVTRAESELEPRQWICHRDRLDTDPRHCVVACVLYLFEDTSLGGTAFYAPTRSEHETDRIIHDSGTLGPEAFARKYELTPGYPRANGWFARTAVIAPRFNRVVFYLGGEVFHAGDIPHPEKLSPDPTRGRLTLNGFFVCRRAAR